jgi:Cdc6-like AAA superfamily ATPase
VLAEEPDEVYWLEVIAALPQHQQALVAAVAEAMEKTGEEYVVSGKVYSFYGKWCQKMGMRPLKYPVYSSELIPYLNISGIIEAEKVSMGRGKGVTRLLRLNRYISPSTVIRKALTDLVKQPVQLPP